MTQKQETSERDSGEIVLSSEQLQDNDNESPTELDAKFHREQPRFEPDDEDG